MEDFERDFDTEEEKEKHFIKMFFEKKMIWENKNCYVFLNEPQFKIAIELLKSLEKNQPISQEKLILDIKPKIKEYLLDILKKYDNIPSKIRASKKDKWIIYKKKNSNEYAIRTLDSTIKTVIRYMWTFLMKRKLIWDKSGKHHNAYILHLQPNGKKLVEAIQKREEKIPQNSVKEVYTP